MKDNLKDIGILRRRHYDYSKTNKPTVINVMRIEKTEGVNEQLKATDQLEWVGHMNNICSRATEVVNK